MGQARVRVPAERSLQDPAVPCPVEHGSPGLELTDPVRGFHRVELGHSRVVQQLPADHRVPEVRLPRVLGVNVGEGRRDAALGHHRVGLAEQRLAHEPDARPRVVGLDRRAEPGAAGANDEDVDGVRLDLVVRLRGEGHPAAC
jgi:hypothetical protein